MIDNIDFDPPAQNGSAEVVDRQFCRFYGAAAGKRGVHARHVDDDDDLDRLTVGVAGTRGGQRNGQHAKGTDRTPTRPRRRTTSRGCARALAENAGGHLGGGPAVAVVTILAR